MFETNTTIDPHEVPLSSPLNSQLINYTSSSQSQKKKSPYLPKITYNGRNYNT